MKTSSILTAVAILLLCSCGTGDKAASIPSGSATVAPTNTVINQFERKEKAEIQRDTTHVAGDTALTKVP